MERQLYRSLAMEILKEEKDMYRPYLPDVKIDPDTPREHTSADSGMEDVSTSPSSTTSSELKHDYDHVESTGISGKPLLHSEGSAFSKIRKFLPTNPESRYPPPPSFPLMYHTSNMTYFPHVPLTPWIPADALAKSFPQVGTNAAIPVSQSESQPLTEPSTDNVFYRVDPRIPFTNYFMNLTKLLKREEASNNINESENKEEESSSDEVSTGSNIVADRVKTEKKDEGSFEMNASKTNNSDYHTTSTVSMNNGLHPYQHFPHKIPPIESLHSLSTLHFMSGMTGPSAMFHPAFLQMTALGQKRLNPEKPPPVKKYKCDVCGKAFSRSNTLVTHKRIHTGDKPFKCEVCGRAFRQPGNLTRHRLTHTTVKPYVCPTCNKAFNRASNLHTHMRTHTNYRPFICPYCGKGFHQKIDMKIHCYTHTGERPHRCDICGKGFTLASTLNTHRRIHTQQHPLPVQIPSQRESDSRSQSS